MFKRLGDEPLCTEALGDAERKASSLAPSLHQGELPNAQWAPQSPYDTGFPFRSLGSLCLGCLPSLPADGSVHVDQATKLPQPLQNQDLGLPPQKEERDPSSRKKRTQQPLQRGLQRVPNTWPFWLWASDPTASADISAVPLLLPQGNPPQSGSDLEPTIIFSFLILWIIFGRWPKIREMAREILQYLEYLGSLLGGGEYITSCGQVGAELAFPLLF